MPADTDNEGGLGGTAFGGPDGTFFNGAGAVAVSNQ